MPYLKAKAMGGPFDEHESRKQKSENHKALPKS